MAARRKAAGYTSQESFAPCTGYSRSTVVNVETGRQSVPADFWRRCDAALGTGGALSEAHAEIERLRQRIHDQAQQTRQAQRDIALQRAWQNVPSTDRPAQPQPAYLPATAYVRHTLDLDGREGVDRTRRRTFLATPVAAPFTLLQPRDGVPYIVADDARRIRLAIPDLYHLDDQVGGDAVAEVATSWLHRVDELINVGEYTEATGQQLQVAFGELAEMTGWLHFDAGRYQQSRFFYGEALRAAQLGDDLNLEVLVLASMNTLARYQQRPREAIQLAQLAQRRAAGWAPPRLRALLAAREAVSWAQDGDPSACRTAMHHAENTFDPAARDDDPAWIAFFDSAELAALRATAFSHLGQHDRAAVHMQTAVDTLSPAFVRNTAYYRLRLALLHLVRGDEVTACEAARPALPLLTTVRSGRARARFVQLHTKISGSRSSVARALLDYAGHLGLIGAAA